MTPVDRNDMHDELLPPVSPDLVLITDFLANELPEEQVAEVRRRLETDPEFRVLAAPLVAAWTIPPHARRHPMPRETVEKRWNELTRRAGFVHQRRKTRRRWTRIIFGIALTVIAVIGLEYWLRLWLASKQLEYIVPTFDSTGAALVTESGRVMTLADGTRVQLDSGATLEVARSVGRDRTRAVRLVGGARFTVTATDQERPVRGGRFQVLTHAGIVSADDGGFRVRAAGDTTDVVYISSNRRPPQYIPAGIWVGSLPVRGQEVILRPGERARAVYQHGVTSLDTIFPDTILPLRPGARDSSIRRRNVKTVAPAPSVSARAAPSAAVSRELTDTMVFSIADSAALKRIKAAYDSGGTVDMWALWQLLAKPIADSGRTMTLASGARVTLEPGARAWLMPGDQNGPGRFIAFEGTASFVVPPLAPFGSSRATSFMVNTRAGMVSAANATAFKVSARGDTTDVEVFALAPDPRNSAPPSPGLVMLMSLSLGPQSKSLVLLPGQAGRLVQGAKPEKLKGSP